MTTTDTPKKKARHDPSFQRDQPSDLEPLSDKRLVQIWRQLPEGERLPFLIALDEPIAIRLFELTMPERQERISQ